MARGPQPSISRPTLPYFAYRGPHKVATGDLSPAGLPGLVVAPASGRRLPIVAFGHGWLQSVDRYAATMRYLASWGIIVVAPNTHRGPISSHQGLALDLSRALRMVAYGSLGGGRVRGDLRRMGVIGHSIGGGAAMLAAAKDDGIKAVVTVTAAETSPSAIAAAGLVEAPSLHIVGGDDWVAESDGEKIARSCTGRAQLRKVSGAGHMGLVERRNWTNTVTGGGPDRQLLQLTRQLASAFFIRHLTDAPQLADQLDAKLHGTKPLSVEPEPPDDRTIGLEELSREIARI